MSFTSKNLHKSSRGGLNVLKGATLFFLGMSCVLFLTRAYLIIQPSATNTQTVFEKLILTLGGDPTAPTGVVLNGASGDAYFAGKVGVGIENPQYELEVAGNGQAKFAGQYGKITINNTHMTASTPELLLQSNGIDMFSLKHMPSGLARGVNLVGYTNQPMRFWTNDTQQMIIDENGKVGIGTATPSEKLEVNDGNVLITNGQTESVLTLKQNDMGGPALVGKIDFIDTNTSSNSSIGSWLTTMGSSDLIFETSVSGVKTEKMRIKGNGNVGIGTDTPGKKLDVNGDIQITNNGLSRTIKMADYPTPATLYIIGGVPNVGVMGIGSKGGNISVSAGAGGMSSSQGGDGGNVYINGGAGGDGPSHADGEYGNVILSNDGGNVSIGTNTPTAKLDVNGDIKVGESLKLYSDPMYSTIQANQRLQFDTNGNNTRMTINAVGNVGIGTTNPSTKLHVAGITKIDSSVQIWNEAGNARCNSTGDRGKLVYINTCYATGGILTYTPTFLGCIGSGENGYFKKAFMTGTSWTEPGSLCASIYELDNVVVPAGGLLRTE